MDGEHTGDSTRDAIYAFAFLYWEVTAKILESLKVIPLERGVLNTLESLGETFLEGHVVFESLSMASLRRIHGKGCNSRPTLHSCNGKPPAP